MAHVRSTDEYPNDWARLIAEIVERPGWNRQRLAETAKVHRHTIRRWISGESANVTKTSMMLVAEAADLDFEVVASAAAGAQEQHRAADDRAIQRIMDSELSDPDKREMIRHVRTRRLEAEEMLERDVDLMLRHRLANP